MTTTPPPTARYPIGLKLSLAVVTALCVVLGVAMGIVSWVTWRDLSGLAEQNALMYGRQVLSTVQSFDESLQQQAQKDFSLFKARFAQGAFDTTPGTGSDGKPQNILRFAGQALNGQFDVVDRYTQETGGTVATLFVRQGDDFLRVSTSLKRQDGQRAIGTLLGKAHPAYQPLVAGKGYLGRATLFGREYMAVYEPVVRDGQTIGILFIGTEIGATLDKVYDSMRKMQVAQTGRVFAVDLRDGPAKGRLYGLAEANARLDLEQPRAKTWFDGLAAVDTESELATEGSALNGFKDDLPRYLAVGRYVPWGWAVVAEAPVDELTGPARHAITWLWGGVAVAVLILVGVLWWSVGFLVSRPVRELSAGIAHLSSGDLRQTITVRTQDEMGLLASNLEAFRLNLVASLGTVRGSADAVAAASGEIAQGNQDLSNRTEQQASALQQTSSQMDTLGAAVSSNADHAGTASTLADEASGVAERGGQAVVQVVAAMRGIQDSSQKIADIIGVIDGIAFQTNILALNAAVEAARAGEQGRGFAVVAAEVRSLAQRSASAAREIKGLIQNSVEQVATGSRQVDAAGQTMQAVVDAIRRVDAVVREIASASQQQRVGVGSVGDALVAIDQGTQQNAALVEQMAAAASSLSQQADQLVSAVSRFRLA